MCCNSVRSEDCKIRQRMWRLFHGVGPTQTTAVVKLAVNDSAQQLRIYSANWDPIFTLTKKKREKMYRPCLRVCIFSKPAESHYPAEPSSFNRLSVPTPFRSSAFPCLMGFALYQTKPITAADCGWRGWRCEQRGCPLTERSAVRASRGAVPPGPAVPSGAAMKTVPRRSGWPRPVRGRRQSSAWSCVGTSDAGGIPRADRCRLSYIAHGCVPSRSFTAVCPSGLCGADSRARRVGCSTFKCME